MYIMVGSGFKLMHGGLRRFHHVGLIVPLLAVLSPMVIEHHAGLNAKLPHQAAVALAYGAIVAAVSYFLMTYVPFLKEERYALNKAVLLGLLVAEVTVFSASPALPSVVLIAFFMFMYLFGIAEVE